MPGLVPGISFFWHLARLSVEQRRKAAPRAVPSSAISIGAVEALGVSASTLRNAAAVRRFHPGVDPSTPNQSLTMKLPGTERVYVSNLPTASQTGATEDEMLTCSSYALSGSPQLCAFCRRPFPSVEERREAFHSKAARGYFCDARCAQRFIEGTVEQSQRRAA
ncbi:MAG TPA: hypothetical protein VK456_05190 [Xanthobacteraceae bacterium]|nr:hypothetical protein [Xanthobacteraceae bacterium]